MPSLVSPSCIMPSQPSCGPCNTQRYSAAMDVPWNPVLCLHPATSGGGVWFRSTCNHTPFTSHGGCRGTEMLTTLSAKPGRAAIHCRSTVTSSDAVGNDSLPRQHPSMAALAMLVYFPRCNLITRSGPETRLRCAVTWFFTSFHGHAPRGRKASSRGTSPRHGGSIRRFMNPLRHSSATLSVRPSNRSSGLMSAKGRPDFRCWPG